jgi:hypothetical protein
MRVEFCSTWCFELKKSSSILYLHYNTDDVTSTVKEVSVNFNRSQIKGRGPLLILHGQNNSRREGRDFS